MLLLTNPKERRSLFNALVKAAVFGFFLNLAASLNFWPLLLLFLFLVVVYRSLFLKHSPFLTNPPSPFGSHLLYKRRNGKCPEEGEISSPFPKGSTPKEGEISSPFPKGSTPKEGGISSPSPRLFASYWLVPIIALAALSATEFLPGWLVTPLASVIFFLSVYPFSRSDVRGQMSGVRNTLVFLLLFLFFFSFPPETILGSLWPVFILFGVSFLLFKDAFKPSTSLGGSTSRLRSDVPNIDQAGKAGSPTFVGDRTSDLISINISPKRLNIISAVLGLVITQVSFLLSLTPLGFVNSSVFAVLAVIFARDSVIRRFWGELDFSFVLRQLTFFVALAVIIFAATNWTL